ncbi:hypothetical protein Rhal01_03100 [Rubritalea halochordaticola]|uniref:Uncharacterized protein n=1 Tax=Rubritalea halochordaticola TaxID=714537 RepID=A0ABP9V8F0_9BACT
MNQAGLWLAICIAVFLSSSCQKKPKANSPEESQENRVRTQQTLPKFEQVNSPKGDARTVQTRFSSLIERANEKDIGPKLLQEVTSLISEGETLSEIELHHLYALVKSVSRISPDLAEQIVLSVDLTISSYPDELVYELIHYIRPPFLQLDSGLASLESTRSRTTLLADVATKVPFEDFPRMIERVNDIPDISNTMLLCFYQELFRSKGIRANDLDNAINMLSQIEHEYEFYARLGLRVRLNELKESGEIGPDSSAVLIELLEGPPSPAPSHRQR